MPGMPAIQRRLDSLGDHSGTLLVEAAGIEPAEDRARPAEWRGLSHATRAMSPASFHAGGTTVSKGRRSAAGAVADLKRKGRPRLDGEYRSPAVRRSAP